MKPDPETLQRFREMRDTALYAPLMTEEERAEHRRQVAEQAAWDAAKVGSA